MKKYHRSYSTCADVVQKNHDFIALRVFSNIDAASLPLNVYYRVIAVREGGTPRRRVPGVCNRHNTSRLVRGRLRKILRYATPRRPPATVVDVRRAIRVEGSVQILLHHKKL